LQETLRESGFSIFATTNWAETDWFGFANFDAKRVRSHGCILLTMQARDLDSAMDAALLPYLPRERIKSCYAQSPGNELRDKFISAQSSAALVANAFGLFLENPPLLEGLPGGPALDVDLEKSLRFPWSGGRHPYLDVVVTGSETLVGVESKRYEPFRGHTVAEISAAYRRPVWGAEMSGYEAIRDRLYADPRTYSYLDAGQLIKHALGLRTAVNRQPVGIHYGKRPVLLYLYAEPTAWPDRRAIPLETHAEHAAEIESFANTVAGNEVEFCAMTYRALLMCWSASRSQVLQSHAQALSQRFLL
jgi:hypothetical protein